MQRNTAQRLYEAVDANPDRGVVQNVMAEVGDDVPRTLREAYNAMMNDPNNESDVQATVRALKQYLRARGAVAARRGQGRRRTTRRKTLRKRSLRRR